MSPASLPIDAVLAGLVETLRGSQALVLEAPPGAGKTTRVPRALLDAGFSGEIVVLEPRRLAARFAARRVADELGERVGERVGYTVRFEDVSSAKTRIRFVTEGVLTRRLVEHPDLPGIGTVILDEFHERHLQGDVALALLQRLRKRRDLRVVVMSATLATDAIARYLGCAVVRSEGRAYPVDVRHADGVDDRALELQVASAVRALVKDGLDGHVLVFVPGAAEIRRTLLACGKLSDEADLELVGLHGDLPASEQDRALGPSTRRKVIVSTNLAESSVTIEGVVAIVDSGLTRIVRHAPWSGLSSLVTEKASRASAVQRAGRAGRTRPGRALRLYTKADFESRPEFDVPEIERADLAQTLLELHVAGVGELEWLDAPKPAALEAARDLLTRLGALEGDLPTALGKRLLAFPVHPRLGRIVVEAERRGVAQDGALIAGLLGERDIRVTSRATFGARRGEDGATEASDVLARVDAFCEAEASGFSASALRSIGLDGHAVQAVERARKQIGRVAKNRAEAPETPQAHDDALLMAVLAGYPDRVAKRRRQGARDLALAQGGAAELSEASAVRHAPWMVAVDAEVVRGRTLVRIASRIEPEWLMDMFESRIRDENEFAFDADKGSVVGSSNLAFDGLTLASSPGFDADDPRVAEVLFEHARAAGARAFVAEDQLDRWLARARFAHSQDASFPAPSDEDVEAALRELCSGRSSFSELRRADLLGVLRARASADPRRLEHLAPESVTLSNGRSARIEYTPGKAPHLESHLQDFFGMKATPRAGTVPIVVHLLAPNRRAVQVTTDLEGFWQKHYPAIRKELMRKYPRYTWPENPSTPMPRIKPRGT